MTVTAQEVIDRARARHWSFSGSNDGAALQYLNEQQRKKLLLIIKTVEKQIGETSEIDTVVQNGALVAIDAAGAAYFTTTVEAGYCLRFDDFGLPYIDVSDPFVIDPFGIDSDTPGIPLPDDMLRLITVSAMTTESTIVPRNITVLPQELAQKASASLGLRAFVSANRLIPVRWDTNDLWALVTSIRIGCVRCPELTALSDIITVPTPCIHAMTAGLAEWFATGAERCPAADKTRFEKQHIAADADLLATIDSLEAVTSSTVIYKR
jgi:hypothetical protein